MRILVVDDTEKHRQSAHDTLCEHDLTVVSSYDEVLEILRFDDEKSGAPPFDLVMTDLLMPMSKRTLTREAFSMHEQVPYGFVIAMLAAKRGVRQIAVVTDIGHHDHAMSAAIDILTQKRWLGSGPVIDICGAKCVFFHAPMLEEIVKDVPCTSCTATGVCNYCKGTGSDNYDSKCSGCGKEGETIGVCIWCKGTKRRDDSIYEKKNWLTVFTMLTKLLDTPGPSKSGGPVEYSDL